MNDEYRNDEGKNKRSFCVEERDSGAQRRSSLSRRRFLACMAALGAGSTLSPASLGAQTSYSPAKEDVGDSSVMSKKIDLEAHFLSPNTVDYFTQGLIRVGKLPSGLEKIVPVLTDFGDRRLEAMDKGGIALSVLSSSTGVQIEKDKLLAVKRAKGENDFLANEIQKCPTRYAGFATLPMQDPGAAADELERCVRDLGFKGTLIHGHIQGRYLDEDFFIPFWERQQELDVPVYLHPATSFERPYSFKGRDELIYCGWDWTVEAGTHALRLVLGGTFERFPKVRLILGHMGETLPYLLYRLDSRWKVSASLTGKGSSIIPSKYIKRNMAVTTSGVFSNEPLQCALAALGEDNVMFSVDYPYESCEEAAQFISNAPVSAETRGKVAYRNTGRILHLSI